MYNINQPPITATFNLEDVIVYQGIITKFGVLYPLVNWQQLPPNTELRLATPQEITRYINCQAKN
jgi:hypothetical protein